MKNCIQCPDHKVVSDPDPHDWFCDDDVAVVCQLTPCLKSGRIDSKFRTITLACRPYNTEKETTPVPEWCPKKKRRKREMEGPKHKKPIPRLPRHVIQGNISFLENLKKDAFKGDHPGIDKILAEMSDLLVSSQGMPKSMAKGGRPSTAAEIKERIRHQ